MRVKKVNRYYCDFCKKAGCSGGHMKKHEERCTLNPNRICGMCKTMDERQPDLKKLIGLLPNIKEYEKYNSEYEYMEYDVSNLKPHLKGVLKIIRGKTNNCPACILAVIRQAKIPVSLVEDFNFSKECKQFWNDFNDSQSGLQ
ncbi:unnamed protein product [marine sediment metagenome]|uniref:Uncharacterized protein n=1 Tax=marine sediment metagenome TaxID=412755 RepID=X0SGD0_9ZZZZ